MSSILNFFTSAVGAVAGTVHSTAIVICARSRQTITVTVTDGHANVDVAGAVVIITDTGSGWTRRDVTKTD